MPYESDGMLPCYVFLATYIPSVALGENARTVWIFSCKHENGN